MAINPHLSSYMLKLADTEPTEIRSNRNGGWQSLNKKFLDPESHPTGHGGIRKHVRKLRSRIDACLRRYFDEHLQVGSGSVALPEYEVHINASWANVNPPGAINGPHVHPFASVSGAYYVDCGGNATSCTISLVDPRPSAPMANLPSPVRDALDFGIDWSLQLWPGTVLIFPSWLTHWVPPHTGAGRRKTISFNAAVSLIEDGRGSPASSEESLEL
eukprot:gnl/TRDRNA2_/TRDRNA2_81445_c0_seq2.p1 gnl/TRDRNA2_/TRDRNA2_81445_c0~~gnl/TRDRNA2_/TRDRNA2_81445_c0_seq2.p1  ORF type:complete len:216 (-),score=23.23 gnl/TRDRNA2_/TRDRNA2_81445_c0_seq2:25-672(-)